MLTVPILAYHQIVTEDADRFGQPGLVVRRKDFEWQMLTLKRLGYRTISLAELYQSLENSSPLGRSVVVSFDDGYAGVYEHGFPILKALGFRAVLFLITEDFVSPTQTYVTRAFPRFTIAQAQAMARSGFEIGSHTITHPRLTDLASRELKRELVESREMLEEVFHIPIVHLAYPYGAYNAEIITHVAAANYTLAFGTQLGRTHSFTQRYALNRIPIGLHQRRVSFLRRLLLS